VKVIDDINHDMIDQRLGEEDLEEIDSTESMEV
jgi:hypothetical protein